MPETSEGGEHSVAEQTILAWHQVHGQRLRVVVIGMSFGGYSALRLCRKLEVLQVEVDELFTLDARTLPQNYRHFITPSNVVSHHNYFQKGFMPGYEIDGAVNRRVRGVSHGTLPRAPEVVRHYEEILGLR